MRFLRWIFGKKPRSPQNDFAVHEITGNTLDEFSTQTLTGSAQCRVTLPEVADVLDSLYSKHQGSKGNHSTDAYVKMVYKKLHGVCPACNTRSDAKTLFIILTARNVGGDFGPYSQGSCRGRYCSCKEIVLYWDNAVTCTKVEDDAVVKKKAKLKCPVCGSNKVNEREVLLDKRLLNGIAGDGLFMSRGGGWCNKCESRENLNYECSKCTSYLCESCVSSNT